MEQVLFYGVPSGCSFGAIVALEWLEEPYRLCRIDMPGMVTSDAYRRVNPVAETPALRTRDGALLAESMAILNHLGARGLARGLSFAQGTADFDRLNAMLAFLNTSFFNGFSPLWHAVEHDLDAAAEAALRAYGAANVAKAHADLEAMLGDGPWLLGDRRTLADAYFVGVARWADHHDAVDRRDHPRLQRLFAKLEADPGVRFAHAIERGEPARGGGGFRGEIGLAEASSDLGRSRAA
jgi:glutathione S-transferase